MVGSWGGCGGFVGGGMRVGVGLFGFGCGGLMLGAVVVEVVVA